MEEGYISSDSDSNIYPPPPTLWSYATFITLIMVITFWIFLPLIILVFLVSLSPNNHPIELSIPNIAFIEFGWVIIVIEYCSPYSMIVRPFLRNSSIYF